ncbi:adenylate/guanylate cyclase domain-containing protein [Synechococcus sp. PCC 6312]|uniref:adenylate/guanylate cyclase domain-containing protein n=1 Tax=Synechococcus sp. (strain ATCC 27167 / PCC 6312) TaxID=195253 RepID=UPI00029F412E|nr:adenylate/guanylate cyclase domain-containing protein [Synechococcus sp. PCC 6312]AFY61745.1 family 3 adenylate cyclase [Synechococcus sp. PCC 6312]
MPEIYCRPDGETVPINPNETVLDALLRANIDHTHVCGGHANCSTCRIMVLDGIEHCTLPSGPELALAKKLDFPFHIRLACQTKVSQGKVEIRRMVLDRDDIGLVDQQLAHQGTGAKKNVALLVAGIRGEAEFDEVNFPFDVVYVISRYFNRLHQVVSKFGGTLNNFLGNRAIATFGVEENEDSARQAIWAALEMQTAMGELNHFLHTLSYQPLQLTIGVHFGPVVLVPVDPTRPEFVSPFGEAVNVATLIEAANKNAGTSLLVSGDAHQQVKDAVTTQRTGRLARTGGDLTLVEITAITGEPPFVNSIVSQATAPGLSLGQRVTAFMNRFKK